MLRDDTVVQLRTLIIGTWLSSTRVGLIPLHEDTRGVREGWVCPVLIVMVITDTNQPAEIK